MTKKKTCRHHNAIILGYHQNHFWCPECGAIRKIQATTAGNIKYLWKKWLYPGEHEKVYAKLEKLNSDIL